MKMGVAAIIIFIQFNILLDCINGKILIGEMLSYFQIVSKVDVIISEILISLFEIYSSLLYLGYLAEFLNIQEDKGIENITYKSFENNNKLCVKNLSFSYPKQNKLILDNISFEAKCGEIIAIVGNNGSGKTTLLNLISGLYQNYEGKILYGKEDIKDVNLHLWKKIVAVMQQDYNKYEIEFYENITLFNSEPDNDKVNDIIKRINFKSILDKLPKGMKTQLGMKFSGGIQLSEGEWQKIAYARTVFHGGQILCLDEPTAAIDNKSSEMIFKDIKYLLKEKKYSIALIITHSVENLHYADKILLLDKGKQLLFGKSEEVQEFIDKYKGVMNERKREKNNNTEYM